jgi:zinc D-Ala-D-Ala dipeptidase
VEAMSTSPRENDMPDARSRRAEPLRDLGEVEALRTASWNSSGVRLRAGVVDRLMVAQTLVPRALRFLIIAGHYLPSSTCSCPHATGHATGGAVDLTAYVGSAPTLWSAVAPPEWPVVAEALRSVDMVNGDQWWHWSFGDASWCDRLGKPEPLYDAVS